MAAENPAEAGWTTQPASAALVDELVAAAVRASDDHIVHQTPLSSSGRV